MVEPLEQVIDGLKEQMRTRHILRLQQGLCSIDAGFIWADLLTNLERTSDHCSNIAGCVIDMAQGNMNIHKILLKLLSRGNMRFGPLEGRDTSLPLVISSPVWYACRIFSRKRW